MNNTTEKTEYQQIHAKLDDSDFAREFFEQKQKEAEELIAQILMVTSGVSEVRGLGVEWGHENLFRLFEIFQIRHKNFPLQDLAENLQFYIFTWTKKHQTAYHEWSDPLEVIKSYRPKSDEKTETEESAKGEKVESETLTEEEIEANETYERFSHSRVLADENEVYQLFAGIVNHPKLSPQDQKKIFDIINKNSLVSKDELKEISLVSGFKESLNSDLDESKELQAIANQLSSIMKNDLMPPRLFNVIADELSEVPEDWRTPENVLFNLQEMRKKEGDE